MLTFWSGKGGRPQPSTAGLGTGHRSLSFSDQSRWPRPRPVRPYVKCDQEIRKGQRHVQNFQLAWTYILYMFFCRGLAVFIPVTVT